MWSWRREEGTQSAWIYEILSPYAEDIVVAMAPESRGQKSDESDAFQLAEQLEAKLAKKDAIIAELRTPA
ncbi:MAG: hypothetical protein QM820_32460 [Minicystis sp.]